MSNESIVCKHGRHAPKCEVCELEAELAALRSEREIICTALGLHADTSIDGMELAITEFRSSHRHYANLESDRDALRAALTEAVGYLRTMVAVWFPWHCQYGAVEEFLDRSPETVKGQ